MTANMITVNTKPTFPETCDRKEREHNVKEIRQRCNIFIRKDIMLSIIGPVLSRKRIKEEHKNIISYKKGTQ